MRTNASFSCEAAFVYVYGLCNLSNLCVQIRLFCVKRLLHTCTSCALKESCGFLQSLGDLLDVAMMFVDSFDKVMTVVIGVL